jgi:HEAT repeat protein
MRRPARRRKIERWIQEYLVFGYRQLPGIDVGIRAAAALDQVGWERVLEVARRMMVSKNGDSKFFGAYIVLRRDASAYLPLVLPLLDDTDEDVRGSVAALLTDFGDARATEPLIKLLAEEASPDNRIWAARALGRCGDLRGLNVLKWAAKYDDGQNGEVETVQFAAEQAIQLLLKRHGVREG